MNNEMAEGDHQRDVLALLLTNQQQIHENIKFADLKAGAITAFNSVLLLEILKRRNDSPIDWAITGLVSVLLLVGIGLAFGVIYPRGWRSSQRGAGVIDANRISRFKSEEEFRNECAYITSQELLGQMRTFLYDRAWIDREKYKWLKYSLFVSVAAWFIVVGVTLFRSYPNVQAKSPKGEVPGPDTPRDAMANEPGAFRVRQSAVHLVGKNRWEAHTFLIDETNGTIWQMVCDAKGLVKFQEVKKVALGR